MRDQQRPIRPIRIDQDLAGYFRFVVSIPGGKSTDITVLRDKPITLSDFSFTDPFGPDKMGLTFPQVSMFDRKGFGDLDWAVRGANLDVVWVGDLPVTYPFGTWIANTWVPSWRWEGYLSTFGWSASGMTVQFKGAQFQMDNFLAKPEYLSRPIPYEYAIARQFLGKPSLRLAPLKVIWPDWWPTRYTPVLGAPGYMVPSGVRDGDRWTGLLTRATGSWDPALTSYIQTMLASMYTGRGRWTMDLLQGRQPVLFHRNNANTADSATVIIDPVLPDNTFDLSEDWEQSLTTVYGQGTSLAGVAYTGMEVSADGSSTTYTPLAASRQVYPPESTNSWLSRTTMAKEVSITMQQGLDAEDAAVVGRAHLSMFSEPGLTGTISIGVDPVLHGQSLPRHLVRAGMQVVVPGLFGRPEGVLMHVVSSAHTLDKTTLTVDSKFRDALTVNEVRMRGKDSLSISRMLVGGGYTPPVSDQLVPWNYAAGSGYIPSNALHSAVSLFGGMPPATTFPWESWTVQRPPSSSSWNSSYLRLGPRSTSADGNWVTQRSAAGANLGVPIKLSQAGTSRLLQIAAYDRDGKVLKVPFHVGFYNAAGVNVASMPLIPVEQVSMFPPYLAGQHSPYVRGGFETIKADGTKDNPAIPHPTDSVGLIRTWGNFYEKAGFFPGSYATGDAPTGLLVDETPWTWDLTGILPFNPYDSSSTNMAQVGAGMVYMMIFCDAHMGEAFFLGRIFRVEPGLGG